MKQSTSLLVFFLFVLLNNFNGIAAKKDSSEIQQNCLDVHHYWIDEAFILTKNTVGFTAPVSGRAYSYFSISMYESSVEIVNELQSITGQLDGYNRTIWKEKEVDYNWELVANAADYTLLSYMFRGLPPSNKVKIDLANDSIIKKYAKKCSKKIKLRSISYGEKIANEIIEWSKLDGGDEGYLNNFPEDFLPPRCAACWVKTTPGYLPSLLPYWGENKQLLKESNIVSDDCTVFEYSTDENSFMYEEAMRVLDNSKEMDPRYELIAEYWDDGAGYSGTPTGHFFTIASQLVKEKKIPIDQALELYVKLGVTVNEAFIAAFRLKYKYNFIRPITYIHQNIDQNFNTRIASPPFPEFPSGHSFQSGAATEVMKTMLGDEVAITDSTNVNRTDIDGTPRSYTSFTEMSEEISVSRLYGGIHFLKSLDESLAYGRKIGIYVADKLKCRK